MGHFRFFGIPILGNLYIYILLYIYIYVNIYITITGCSIHLTGGRSFPGAVLQRSLWRLSESQNSNVGIKLTTELICLVIVGYFTSSQVGMYPVINLYWDSLSGWWFGTLFFAYIGNNNPN